MAKNEPDLVPPQLNVNDLVSSSAEQTAGSQAAESSTANPADEADPCNSSASKVDQGDPPANEADLGNTPANEVDPGNPPVNEADPNKSPANEVSSVNAPVNEAGSTKSPANDVDSGNSLANEVDPRNSPTCDYSSISSLSDSQDLACLNESGIFNLENLETESGQANASTDATNDTTVLLEDSVLENTILLNETHDKTVLLNDTIVLGEGNFANLN